MKKRVPHREHLPDRPRQAEDRQRRVRRAGAGGHAQRAAASAVEGAGMRDDHPDHQGDLEVIQVRQP